MLFYWLLFFFLTVGAKFLLASLMIYLLLPSDARCNHCDADTLLIRANRIGSIGSALSFGRVQWRWCPRCDWEGLARRIAAPTEPALRIERSRAITRK